MNRHSRFNKKSILIYFLLFAVVSFWQSCLSPPSIKPGSIGSVSQMTVIADNTLWEGMVGDTFRYFFQGPYPILPQPEPLFDVAQFAPDKLTDIRREMRVLVFLGNLNDKTSATSNIIRQTIGEENVQRAKDDPTYGTIIGRDRWASNQTVFYIFAHSDEQLASIIKRGFPSITEKMWEIDQGFIKNRTFLRGLNDGHNKRILDSFNMNIKIPNGYTEVLHEDNALWLRMDDRELISNIMIYKEKYTSEKQLKNEYLKSLIDTLGKKYVRSELEGSYMRVNNWDLPVFYEQKNKAGAFAVEGRGIWELVNDFMGGPFLAYVILDKDNNNIILVNGFVMAQGKEKRPYMQNLDMIFSTIDF